MSRFYRTLARHLLFRLDAERAHNLSILALKLGIHPRFDAAFDKRLAVEVAGLHFCNPLGMAAGYDKDAKVPDALIRMGFGHAEIGTVTPLPQPGNPRPRVFRLTEDAAVVNRFGFNSAGHETVRGNLLACDRNSGIVGVNLGANKNSKNFAADYVAGIHAFSGTADYFTINISSPNTPGLRALQDSDPLRELLKRVESARAQQQQLISKRVPLFLKVAPDLTEIDIDAISRAIGDSDLDGLIVSNTTLARSDLASPFQQETGGLSGKPLFPHSTRLLAKFRLRLAPEFPLIGVGGIHDADTAWSKIEAGATLIQLYSGMIYEGPELPATILRGMQEKLAAENLTDLSGVIGRKASQWADLKSS